MPPTNPQANRQTQSTKAAAAPKGRFAGLRSAAPRYPLLPAGRHDDLELIKTSVTFNKKSGHESAHFDFKVHKSDTLKTGDIYTVLQIINGKSNDVGPQKCMSYIVAATGFEDDDTFYDQLGETADEILNAVLTGEDKGAGAHTLWGTHVACMAIESGTKEDAAGKVLAQYHNYTWSPCERDPEDEENA